MGRRSGLGKVVQFSEATSHDSSSQAREILTENFSKSDRNEAMSQAFAVHKYTQQEIANHTGLHYGWVSRLIVKTTKSKTCPRSSWVVKMGMG
jgi:hypothetical protein